MVTKTLNHYESIGELSVYTKWIRSLHPKLELIPKVTLGCPMKQ